MMDCIASSRQIAVSRRAEELAKSGEYQDWSDIELELIATFAVDKVRLEFLSGSLRDELDRLCRQLRAANDA